MVEEWNATQLLLYANGNSRFSNNKIRAAVMHFKLQQYLRFLNGIVIVAHVKYSDERVTTQRIRRLFFNWILSTKRFCASSRVKILLLYYFTLMVFSNSLGRTIEARTLSMNETMLNSIFTVNVCACVINMCARCLCSSIFLWNSSKTTTNWTKFANNNTSSPLCLEPNLSNDGMVHIAPFAYT